MVPMQVLICFSMYVCMLCKDVFRLVCIGSHEPIYMRMFHSQLSHLRETDRQRKREREREREKERERVCVSVCAVRECE